LTNFLVEGPEVESSSASAFAGLIWQSKILSTSDRGLTCQIYNTKSELKLYNMSNTSHISELKITERKDQKLTH